MSLTTTNVKNTYTVVSSTDTFSFTFQWFSLDEIEVSVDGVPLIQDTDYTFDNITSNKIGGTVILTVAITSGTLEIKRVTPLLQEADYGNTKIFPSVSVQGVDDRTVAMIQEIVEPVSDIPSFPTAEADTVIGWNSAGTALENKTLPDIEEYEQLASDVETAQTTAETAQTTATAAGNVAASAQLDADGAKATANDALAKANQNESDLANTEAKASSALSLATNNETAISNIDTSVFMDKATYEPRLDAVELKATANETRSQANEAEITDIKSDIVDINDELDLITAQGEQYIGNNVAVETLINDMVFNQVENTFAYITINGFRKTDDNNANFTIQLYAFWDSVLLIWKVGRLSSFFDEYDGITFTMQTVGDVGSLYYVTNDFTGLNYDGGIFYKASKVLR